MRHSIILKNSGLLLKITSRKKAFAERFSLDGDRRASLCPINNPMNLNGRIHMVNNCGSVRLRFAAGELALAIVTQDDALWKKGLWDLDYALSMTNDEGFFVPLSSKGCKALGYTWSTSRLFSLNVEMLKLAGFDLLDYKTRHGENYISSLRNAFQDSMKILQFQIILQKKELVQIVVGRDPIKLTKNFCFKSLAKLDDGRLNDEWVPGFGRFINWSIRFVSEKHPEWIKANTLREVETQPGIGNYFTVTAFEIYNANVLSEPKSIWSERKKIAQKKEAKLQKLKEEKHKRDKAERLRKREMLFSYDGIYKVQLGQNRNLIDGKIFQDLGSIIFTLKRAQAKLDENNILYGAFGLDEINFSLDYDGYMTVSGQILSNVDTERKCVYIVGNLKSDKNFNPKSNQNCSASGQNFSMKFKKVSDDINFNFAQEEDLKELEGEYDVQWFITGINSTERSLYAKDTLTLSKGVGLFSGSEEDKQPSSELRRELSIQYNANGDIVILGKIDLMEKLDAKQWHASGKIHPNQKTTIKTVWGLGDVIELEIENEELRRKRETEEKKKEAELKKLKEKKRKKEQARLQKRKEEKRKRDKAERLRKREMLLTYDGIYKVQIGLNRDLIDGKMYKDLGSILFSLNRGVPKLDDNNILYKAFGLDEINFSLDYDGYMTVSGQILSKLDTGKKCVYIAGNLKSDKKFNPKSRQNCRASGQNFSMKFKKISDDINFNFAQEEDLKELEGEYDVQWFITGINSTERSLYAKDTLLLSNGVGVFSGNEEDKQPSSELRKELSVQYNANGDIVILGLWT